MTLLALCLFFPSVNFGITSAEINPVGILSRLTINKIFKFEIAFVCVLILSAIYGCFYWHHFDLQILRSMAAYLNPLFAFIFVLSLAPEQKEKILKILPYLLSILVLIGLAQFFTPSEYLTQVIQFLVPRGSWELGAVGRGVALLSTEPSRAAVEITFIYTVIRLTRQWNTLTKLTVDIFFVVFISLIIRSFSGLFFCLAALVLLYRSSNNKSALVIILLMLLLAWLMHYSQFHIDSKGNRSLGVLDELLRTPTTELFDLIINRSGFRGVSLIGSLGYAMSNPFGGGVGFWQFSSLEALNLSGYNAYELSYYKWQGIDEYQAIRPTSYFSNLLLDLGIFAIPLCVILIRFIFSRIHKDLIPLLTLFLLYFFLNGAVGNPVPWICLALLAGRAKYV